MSACGCPGGGETTSEGPGNGKYGFFYGDDPYGVYEVELLPLLLGLYMGVGGGPILY
jgi:hypothetical protein